MILYIWTRVIGPGAGRIQNLFIAKSGSDDSLRNLNDKKVLEILTQKLNKNYITFVVKITYFPYQVQKELKLGNFSGPTNIESDPDLDVWEIVIRSLQ